MGRDADEQGHGTPVEAIAEAYDEAARSTGWLGPEVAFGMVFEHLLPGQRILDLGMGTGLAAVLFRKAGLTVCGMDVDQDMLDVCRWKGFEHLARHDLTGVPYPYDPESFDHAICVGVLPFLRDPAPVFVEVGRVLRERGAFAFMTLDRMENDPFELVLGPEYTKTGASVTMYRHTSGQIGAWMEGASLELEKRLPFTVFRDLARTESQQAVCYVARKESRLGTEPRGGAGG
jgi:predicted TPR repeat methyltransferase